MASWGKEMVAVLGIPHSHSYTGHCWRRTGATCLVEEGISEIALKRAGQWKSATAALGYINNSSVAREKQLTMLSFSEKKPKLDNTTNANDNRTQEHRKEVQTMMRNSTNNTNNVKVVDGLTANNSRISLTTNIIIALGDAAKIVGSIMAKEKEMQRNKSNE